MSDLFLCEDARKLFHNKFVVVLGDSIQRSLYKDLVSLLNDSTYVKDDELRSKGEPKFQGDELLEGGMHNLNNGPGYREVREFGTDYYKVQFYFVTRCYNHYVLNVLRSLQNEHTPDVIIMNSCLWDLTRLNDDKGHCKEESDEHIKIFSHNCSSYNYILKELVEGCSTGQPIPDFHISRYGDCSVDAYKSNLRKLFSFINTNFPKKTLFIWNSTLPISRAAYGGFLVPEVEHLKNTLRLEILEANKFAYQLLKEFSFDMLDIHFYLRHHIHRRVKDGVHWDMTAHRRMTNLLLTHISEAWQQKLPGRIQKFDSPFA